MQQRLKRLLLITTLVLAATPAFAKEYTIKEISDPDHKPPYYFSPDKLTIQPGDTVTFVNAQEDTHDVMFISVPKAVDEMIMSPMLKKEGEKWSYTFTVPGTYKFHCHPHEANGMKGSLIVGQASKTGETKLMDHHHMAENMENGMDHYHGDATTTDMPRGTGKVISVDAEKHTIKLKHDPIKALGWPVMTMLFTADNSVDLSGYHPGDSVTFTLKPMGKDDYVIVNLKKG